MDVKTLQFFRLKVQNRIGQNFNLFFIGREFVQ